MDNPKFKKSQFRAGQVYNSNYEPIDKFELAKGHIEFRTVCVHVDAQEFVPEKSHYEQVKHPSCIKVVDSPAVPAVEEHDEEMQVVVFVEDSPADIIRAKRKKECFPIINRGCAWYNLLTFEQKAELDKWYKAWLDAPETGVVPSTPKFVNEKIKITEELL